MKVVEGDAHIIGLDENGHLVLHVPATGFDICSGDTPEKWGWANMTPRRSNWSKPRGLRARSGARRKSRRHPGFTLSRSLASGPRGRDRARKALLPSPSRVNSPS